MLIRIADLKHDVHEFLARDESLAERIICDLASRKGNLTSLSPLGEGKETCISFIPLHIEEKYDLINREVLNV